jgi:hypothetical protein
LCYNDAGNDAGPTTIGAGRAGDMPFDAKKLGRYQVGMRRRIQELKARTEDCLDFAIDHVLQDRIDTYFRIEEALDEIDQTLPRIEEELTRVCDLAGANRLESRLEYMEDRFEEIDSEVRQRPRRRRRKINFADFFRAASGAEPGASRGEISSPAEAYDVLGLADGSSLAAITATFRRRAKHLHPDVRKGDRSSEPELRRIIEAYQYLKDHLSMSSIEPPREW